MGLGFNLSWPVWTRNRKGENFYDVTAIDRWTEEQSNLSMALDHPILTPAMLFIAKLFSQADFSVKRRTTGKDFPNHPILELLENPNSSQTGLDLLEALNFTMIANGVGVIYKKKANLRARVNALYVLNFELIEWPEGITTGNFKNRLAADGIKNKTIIYDKNGENLQIRIGDLLFFYDLPNAVFKNPFLTKSRLDGLKQTLLNTKDSLLAKNIILKTNGKEMISGTKDSFPLTPEEKKDAENLFNNTYGLGFNRKRGLITQATLNHKSLHIALRDLGLDESVKVDGNLIYTALHIPKDIISLEAKKTTYNNFKESMVSYLQNEIQPTLNSFIAVFNSDKDLVDKDYKLTGTYEHLPIMQFILIERYQGIAQRGVALLALRTAGLPDNIALKECGYDETIVLKPITAPKANDTSGNSSSNDTTPKLQTMKYIEDQIRKLIENEYVEDE